MVRERRDFVSALKLEMDEIPKEKCFVGCGYCSSLPPGFSRVERGKREAHRRRNSCRHRRVTDCREWKRVFLFS